MSRQMPFTLFNSISSQINLLGRDSDSEEVYAKADRFLARATWLLWWRLWLNKTYYRIRASSVRWVYRIRNYVVDFLMVVAVALYALLALFGYVDLEWLRQYSPVFK